MSHHPSPYPNQTVVIVKESNGAGLWGFILSLIGLFCCIGGCFSFLGLILSLIGLGRRPRGFAVAGTILSTIGLLGGLTLWVTIGSSVVHVVRTLGLMDLPTIASMWKAEKLVTEDYHRTRKLPDTLDQATGGSIVFNDQWGTPLGYRVNPSGDGYSLHSAGPDTAWGTGDEISYTVLDADNPNSFNLSRGTVSLIEISPLPYTPEQIENAPVDDEPDAGSDAENGG